MFGFGPFQHTCSCEVGSKFKSEETGKREIVEPRQIAHYFSKIHTKGSLVSIGNIIGKKDHATVLNSIKAINNFIDTDKKFTKKLNEIEKMIKNRKQRN